MTEREMDSGDRLMELREMADEGRVQDLISAVTDLDLHPSDLADLIEGMEPGEQVSVIRALPAEMASDALAEMEEGEERDDLLNSLDVRKTAQLLREMADDDAADLIGDLEPHERDRILDALTAAEAVELRGLLAYDDETAGGPHDHRVRLDHGGDVGRRCHRGGSDTGPGS